MQWGWPTHRKGYIMIEFALRAANVVGINSPRDPRNFSATECPRFFSMFIAAMGCELTQDQFFALAGFVAAQEDPTCGPRALEFVSGMLDGVAISG